MKSSREISSGIIIYRHTREGLKFLLLYHGGGYWNFPKGHIEPGEKGLKTALREVAEETGIHSRDIIVQENFKTMDTYFFKKRGRSIFKIVLFYLARAKTPHVKVSWEHEGYGWFLYKDALHLIKYENLRKILKTADQFLKRFSKSRYEKSVVR